MNKHTPKGPFGQSAPVGISIRAYRVAATGLLAGLAALPAQAFEIPTSSEDVKIRWDNTFKYSAGYRLERPSAVLNGDVNQDDGNRNFDRGLVSNRADWLSEFDLTWRNFGLRVSGAAWYDEIYNDETDNDIAATSNSMSVAPDRFTEATRKLHGRKAELLDAFVFAKFNVADRPGTMRLGKHTLVYGETLFFGANGIAAAQAPIDVIKLLSVPSTQFKELLMPVPQISGQLQLDSSWSIGAYYQFSWRESRLPAAGSYLSTLAILDEGGERLIAGPPLVPGGPPAAMFRGRDIEARDSGQGGLQIRFRPESGNAEYGFYAVRYHDKTPQLYVDPSVVPGPVPIILDPTRFDPFTGQIGNYLLVYPEDIKAYGVSVSTVLADFNVAGEMSMRTNMPLVSDGQVIAALPGADNDDNPAYAVGKSGHLNLSAIYIWPQTTFWDNLAFTGEVGYNRLLSVSRNRAALDPNTRRDAWGFRFIVEPTWYQVLSGFDLSAPFGVGFNPKGRSAVVGAFNGGVDGGGDFSIGLKGDWQHALKLSLTYNRYFGAERTNLVLTPAGYQFSFGQPLADRDFISFSAQYSF